MNDSSDFENDYSDVVIVAENEWHSRLQPRTTVCISNTQWEICEYLNASTSPTVTIDLVRCKKLLPGTENCHAEVLFISDNALDEKRMNDSSDFENDYSDVVIVAENEWHSRLQPRTTVCISNTQWEICEYLNASTSPTVTIDLVRCKKLLPGTENCHAEVLFISDNALDEKVRQKFTTDDEDDASSIHNPYHSSVVIRILEDKQKILKEFDNRSAADVIFVVNGKECRGDRKYLAAVSPVLNAMLYGQFAEAQQDRIVLEDIDSVEIFKDFILAISPLRIQPNPSNVVALLKLAHRYDIPFLTRNCEDHLMYCYEISIVDRILIAGKYGLDSLKMSTMQQLCDDDLQEILREKSDCLCEPGCRFLCDIFADRMQEIRDNAEELKMKFEEVSEELQEMQKTQKK